MARRGGPAAKIISVQEDTAHFRLTFERRRPDRKQWQYVPGQAIRFVVPAALVETSLEGITLTVHNALSEYLHRLKAAHATTAAPMENTTE